MSEVFRVNEIGEVTILRPVSADEANTDIFKSLHRIILYCSSARMAAFQLTFTPKWMNCLNKWQAQLKLSPCFANRTDSDEEFQSVSKKDILDA